MGNPIYGIFLVIILSKRYIFDSGLISVCEIILWMVMTSFVWIGTEIRIL
jgi:hypothetical protein